VVGSIKWRERSPFNRGDLAALAAHRSKVPGADQAALIVVSRSGTTVQDVDATYGPAELIAAWH
jgi:hypothetical protein